jgi:hypothetical protein
MPGKQHFSAILAKIGALEYVHALQYLVAMFYTEKPPYELLDRRGVLQGQTRALFAWTILTYRSLSLTKIARNGRRERLLPQAQLV